MVFFFVILVLLINISVGYAAAAVLGRAPRNWRTFVAAMTNQPVALPGNDQISLRFVTDYTVGLEAGARSLDELRDASERVATSWSQQARCLLANIEKQKIVVDQVQQRLMASGWVEEKSQWESFVDDVAKDLAGGLKSLSDSVTKSRKSSKSELFRDAGDLNRVVQALVGNLSSQLSAIQFIDDNPFTSFNEFKRVYYPIAIEIVSLLDEMKTAVFCNVVGSLEGISETEFIDGDPQIKSRVDFERFRLESTEADSEPTSFIGLCSLDNALSCGDGYGRSTLHIALNRFGNELLTHLANQPSIVCQAGDGFLVTGAADSIDEFAGVVEHLRQSIEKTSIRVGGSQINLYVSNVVKPDDHSKSTAEQIKELQKLYHEVATFGGNRTFLCDEEAPTPVVPLELEVADSILTL